MKRSILFLVYVVFAAITSRAQTGATNTPPSPPRQPQPTQQAIHELETIQEGLVDLSQEQVITLNSVLLDKNIALDSLRDHPSGDPKTDNQCRHTIIHDADVRIYSLLNEHQQFQYVLWKQDQHVKNMEKRQQQLTQQAEQAAHAIDSINAANSINHPHG
jgi:hypothetical protein